MTTRSGSLTTGYLFGRFTVLLRVGGFLASGFESVFAVSRVVELMRFDSGFFGSGALLPAALVALFAAGVEEETFGAADFGAGGFCAGFLLGTGSSGAVWLSL